MTVDLWMLVIAAVWCVSIPVIGVAGLFRIPGGPAWGFGNRDSVFVVPAWIERVRRAHMNSVENLAPFAVLVLVAHVSGKANATTALGAQVFLAGRIGHTFVYVAGIPVVRTLMYFVAVVGELLILAQLFS